MVKIRLTRTGKKHEPHYRIVAADSRRARDGRYLERIGYYNPRTKPPTLEYDKEILQKWIDNGAQMTDTIHDIFVKEGIIKQTKKRTSRLDIITKPSPKEAPEGDEAKAEEEPKKEKVPEEKKADKTAEQEKSGDEEEKGEKDKETTKTAKDTKKKEIKEEKASDEKEKPQE